LKLQPLRVLNAAMVVAAVAIFMSPAPAGVSPTVMHAAGLVTLCTGLWATQALPEHLTGLIFLALSALAAVAKPAVIFSGFSSGTLWLVLGGLIIAEAVRHTGLGERVAWLLLGRFTNSYVSTICGIVIVAGLLAFLMPATLARIILLLPIIVALATRIGHDPGSPAYNGMCLAAILASYQIGAAILPANAPNLAIAGTSEMMYGTVLTYGEYFILQFPVMGLVKSALIVAVTCWMFPGEVKGLAGGSAAQPMSTEEKRLAAILLVALAMWATDFLHHIHPGWIGLVAGVLCMLPRVGVLPAAAFNDRIKYGPYFYIGSVLGLGAVIIDTGLARALGYAVLPMLNLRMGWDLVNFMVLSVMSTLAGMLTTSPAQAALTVPLAEAIAQALGWPLKTVVMTFAVGVTTVVLPYMVPPIVVGLRIAGVGFGVAARFTLAVAAAGVPLLGVNYAWWRIVGFL
jgi:anion transporter